MPIGNASRPVAYPPGPVHVRVWRQNGATAGLPPLLPLVARISCCASSNARSGPGQRIRAPADSIARHRPDRIPIGAVDHVGRRERLVGKMRVTRPMVMHASPARTGGPIRSQPRVTAHAQEEAPPSYTDGVIAATRCAIVASVEGVGATPTAVRLARAVRVQHWTEECEQASSAQRFGEERATAQQVGAQQRRTSNGKADNRNGRDPRRPRLGEGSGGVNEMTSSAE
jgi:hypothetical protein